MDQLHFLAVTAVLLAFCHAGYSANIFAIFPTPSVSHQYSCLGFLEGLVAKGHNVTVITTNPKLIDKKPPNYHVIDGSINYQVWENYMRDYQIDIQKERSPFEIMAHFEYVFAEFIDTFFSLDEVQKIIKSPDTKFDLIIYEAFYPAAASASKHFGNIPTVVMSTIPNYLQVESTMGNPILLSYMPSFIVNASDHMTLTERITNIAYYYFTVYIQHVYNYPLQDAVARKYFGDDLEYVSEYERNNSLYLMSGDLSQSYPVPRHPNTIEVGVCHIKPRKPLPEDLKQWMDGAKDGVIYFSLGSNMKGTSLREDLREIFIEVFAKFPNYRIIWKWEDDTPFARKPKNVLLRKWNPQQDILAHPKTKLFISQTGHQSRQEATFYGVPMLCIPLFWDQDYNAKKLVIEGAGLSIPIKELNPDILFEKLQRMLTDNSFKKNMLRLSSLTKDHVMNCPDKVAWWIEYVLRHNGARHLRPASLDLTWYQLYNLDIAAITFSVLTIILFIFYSILKCLGRLCCSSRKDKKIKKR
nr:UDP-glucuronosyltransferase [Nilaparvata lugens]